MNYALGLIHHEGDSFGISFPDFPGCISTAQTMEAAITRGAQALALHVEGMREDDEAMPHLRSLTELQGDAQAAAWMRNAVVAAVPVDFPGKAVRVNISMDEHLLDRVDRAARSAGQSRSAYLAEAAQRRIAEAPGRAA